MKNNYVILPTVFFAIVATTACQTSSKLTADLSGSWTFAPETVSDNDTIYVDMIKTLEFMPVTETSGDIIVSAMISIVEPVEVSEQDSIIAPLTVTGAALASVRGSFEAVSFDKIEIRIDASTFSFTIDPDAVYYHYDYINSQPAPEIAGIRDKYAHRFRDQVAPLIKKRLTALGEMSSIKVKGSLAWCNIDDVDITLRHQSAD